MQRSPSQPSLNAARCPVAAWSGMGGQHGRGDRRHARKNRKETRKPMDNRRAFALRDNALPQGLGYVFEISK